MVAARDKAPLVSRRACLAARHTTAFNGGTNPPAKPRPKGITVLAAIALLCSLFIAAILLLIAFFLLPWARKHVGGWALALIPLSTFVGAYLGWAVLLLLT